MSIRSARMVLNITASLQLSQTHHIHIIIITLHQNTQ